LAEGKTHSGVIIIPRKHCKQVPDIIDYLTLVRDATCSGELNNSCYADNVRHDVN